MKAKTKRIDPSRTGLLRRKFLSDLNHRLAEIITAIRKLIVEDDAFGIAPRTPLVVHAQQQFAFPTDAAKLKAFQIWLKDLVDAKILEVSGKGTPGKPWTYQYVDSAYRKGMIRAFIDSRKVGRIPAWYTKRHDEFLRTAFAQPMVLDKLELLSLRTFEQLRGLTGAISQKMAHVLSLGLVSGWGPEKIAREMRKQIAGISRTRARMITRTEIMHAHAEGQLDTFETLGVSKLGIVAEWSTAGDDLVCARCFEMEGKTFSVEEGRGMIPLHPNSFAKDVEIYTEDGWVNVSALKKGQRCLSLNPEDFDLEYVPVVATVSHSQDRMIHFVSHNFDLLVTPEHDMFALRGEQPYTQGHHWEFIQAKDITCGMSFYRSSAWKGKDSPYIEIEGRRFSTELFFEFMGWWLSEGSLCCEYIVLNQENKANPDRYDKVCEIANKLSTIGKVWCGVENVHFVNPELRTYLSRFDDPHKKHIPEELKEYSPKYLRILLDAYYAGTKIRRTLKCFDDDLIYVTASKRVADDIGELLVKVGRCPLYFLHKEKGEEGNSRNNSSFPHDLWIIRECYSQVSRVGQPYGVRKSIVDYNNMVYCVQLHKFHTLLVRRNGKVAWSGNCRCVWIPSELP